MAADKVKDDEWVDEDEWVDDKPVEKADGIVSHNEPDTFLEGFINSILSGEASEAGLKSVDGFMRGATLDIPSSVIGGLSSLANAAMNPIDTLTELPETLRGFDRNIREKTMMAGSQPEEFGRMMGNMTGQPLATAGLAKGAPMIKAPVGNILEKTGGVMAEHQPMSGMLPNMFDMRTMRLLERLGGERLQKLGKNMQIPVRDGEVVQPNYTDVDFDEVLPTGMAKRPRGNTNIMRRPASSESPLKRKEIRLEGTQKMLKKGMDWKGLPETSAIQMPESSIKGLPPYSTELPASSIIEAPESSVFGPMDNVVNNIDEWARKAISSLRGQRF